MSPVGWEHHTEGTRNYARCSTCGSAICEWRRPWGTEGVPTASMTSIARHLAKCGAS